MVWQQPAAHRADRPSRVGLVDHGRGRLDAVGRGGVDEIEEHPPRAHHPGPQQQLGGRKGFAGGRSRWRSRSRRRRDGLQAGRGHQSRGHQVDKAAEDVDHPQPREPGHAAPQQHRGGNGRREDGVPAGVPVRAVGVGPGQPQQLCAEIGEGTAQKVEAGPDGGDSRQLGQLVGLQHGRTRGTGLFVAHERRHLRPERAGRHGGEEGAARVVQGLPRAAGIPGAAAGRVYVDVAQCPTREGLVDPQADRPFEEHGHPRLGPGRRREEAGVHAGPQRGHTHQVLARLEHKGVGGWDSHSGRCRRPRHRAAAHQLGRVITERMLGRHAGRDGRKG